MIAPIISWLVSHAKQRRQDNPLCTPGGYTPAFKDSAARVDPHLATLMQDISDAQWRLDTYLLSRTEDGAYQGCPQQP